MRKGGFVLAAAIVAGCRGGSSPASSSVNTPAAVASSPPAIPSVATAPWPSSDAVPPELEGAWFLGPQRMRLSGTTYDIGGASGDVLV